MFIFPFILTLILYLFIITVFFYILYLILTFILILIIGWEKYNETKRQNNEQKFQ